MQPDLAFDIYPHTAPKTGARLVRLTSQELLAGSFFRVERRGTGAGKVVLNSGQAAFTAANLHEENLVEVLDLNVSATAPLGGFFLHRGDFNIIDAGESGGEDFGLGGPGLLAYLAREIMWSHTYYSGDLDPALGSVYGQDPFDDIWRLSLAGTGSTLGAMLWRAVYEAQHYRSAATYTHEHGDGLTYTDSHPDDRLANKLADMVIDFTRTVDSSGAAWSAYNGAFNARVKQQLLSVVLELVGKGMDVQMREGRQLKLSAYNSYGRDFRGTIFGPGVVRFAHGVNIANPARRAIEAGLQASEALVGSNDTYARVPSPVPSHVPRSVGLDSDAEELGALKIDGEANLRAREAGSDVPALKVLYGNDPAAGLYQFAPPEVGGHAWVGDLVTIHRGAGGFQWNNADARIEAIQFDLTAEKVWDDPTIEFGSVYRGVDERGRAAAVQAIAGKHSHPPNPQLCRAAVQGGTPIFVKRESKLVTATTDIPITVGTEASRALYLAVIVQMSAVGTSSAAWHPAYVNAGSPGAGEAMTKIASLAHPSYAGFLVEIWRLTNPSASTQTTSAVRWSNTGTVEAGVGGCWLLSGVNQTTPENATATNSGTSGSSSSVTVTSPADDLVLDTAGWVMPNATITAPSVSGGQTQDWSLTQDNSFGVNDVGAGGAHGTSGTPSWNFTNVYDNWLAAAVSVAGAGGADPRDGHRDLVGIKPGKATRCDHRHDVHRDRAPTVNDDWATDGYKLGTIWAQLDSLTAPTAIVGTWMLVDATAGAAKWMRFGVAGAPTDAGYLVTAAHAGLSAEVVVGTSPGGELGGTWAAPTVDAVHSGSSHATKASHLTTYYEPMIDSAGLPMIDSAGFVHMHEVVR